MPHNSALDCPPNRSRNRWGVVVALPILIHWLVLGTTPAAAQDRKQEWVSGAELQKVLAASLNVQSSNEGLRAFLERLAESQHVAVLIDRRVDPSSPHDFAIRQRSLRSILLLAAANVDAGTSQLGDTIYVGPGEIAAAIPAAMSTLRAQVKVLPADAKKIWQRAEPWHSPRLARPAELIRELAEANHIAIEGIDRIPHDLWPPIDLPALSLAERFAGLLVGFNLWPEISPDGKSLRLVEFPLPDTISQSYSNPPAAQFSDWLRSEMPNVQWTKKSSSFLVNAAPADQYRIAVWLAENEVAKASGETPGAKKVVTLNATSSAGSIARQVASQLGVQFVCDRNCEQILETRVEIHVDQVSYPELLSRVFADTGLSFQLDDRQLRVFAK